MRGPPLVLPRFLVIARRLITRTGRSRGDTVSRAGRPSAKRGSADGCGQLWTDGAGWGWRGPRAAGRTGNPCDARAWEDLRVWSVLIPVNPLPEPKSPLPPPSRA